MAVTTEGYFVCDFCGDDHGSFDEKGNHISCTEIAALRSQLVECEKAAEALKSRLDENSNGDLADYDAFDLYEAYKSAHPTEKG